MNILQRGKTVLFVPTSELLIHGHLVEGVDRFLGVPDEEGVDVLVGK